MFSIGKLFFFFFLFFVAVHSLGNMCTSPLAETPSNTQFWVEYITHEGTSPFNGNPTTYPIFRNVKNYGAKGDGVTDDTAAINAAISAGNRCGQGCDSSTVVPAVVYFPSGKYLVTAPLIQYYFTQFIGDALNPPTILASANFAGIGVIDSDPYAAGGASWWTNQNNFYRQVRNFIIDVSQVSGSATGIHWQIAQATSLTNVVFKMATDGRNHQGMFMENGSGGFMSDLVFDGGKLGMWIGNQQFTFRNITVKNAQTGMVLGWNWGFTFKDLKIDNCQVGFDMSAGSPGQLQVGSAIIMDALITNTPVFVKTAMTSSSSPHTTNSLILDNIKLQNVATAVQGASGALVSGVSYIQSWGQGQFYLDKSGKGTFQQGNINKVPTKPAVLLDSTGAFFARPRPQYEKYLVSDFISVKSQGAKGDGKTDDTQIIQTILNNYAGCKIVYFPAGVYLVSSTITVPSGTKIVGEAWSSILATGSVFQDASNPVPVIKVGSSGEQGSVEITDMVFSTQGQTPGAILMEWNLRDPDGQQGVSAMWDSHFRIGGSKGTNLDMTNCQKFTAKTTNCQAAFLCLHITKTASLYLENVWVWTADHDLDNSHDQISLFNGRGVLVESQNGPVWMYGTASEHHTLYQYNIANSQNVLMAMIQTETPYYQSVPPAPSPFTANTAFFDPDFSKCAGDIKCEMSWALYVKNSKNIYVYGAGLYNFFQNYDQGCLTTENCQNTLVNVDSNTSEMYFYNLNTKAANYMVSIDETGNIYQGDNRNTFCSTVAGFFL